jgi:hypothetical protein
MIGSNVANAANECRVQINYKNNKNENINEIRNVDKGNAADINLSGMRFVKNLKNRQVKLLFQPGTVGVYDIILENNQRNPAVGYFINPPRLQKVICLNDNEVTDFTIRLQRGRQTLDEHRITKNMSFDANARKIVKTRRSPPLIVTVYRIGNDSPNNIYKGCWSQENPSQNRLRHDNDVVVENEVDESSSGERNNIFVKSYIETNLYHISGI